MTRARLLLALGFAAYACTTYDESLLDPSGSAVDQGKGGSAGSAGSASTSGRGGSAGSSGSIAAGADSGANGGEAGAAGADADAGGEGGVLGIGGEAGGGDGPPAVGTGSIKYKRWNNVPGWNLSAIPIDTLATEVTVLSELKLVGTGENYGAQLVGFITPPVSGQYKFWIACDNNCELRLSTDESTAGLKVIAYVAGQFNSTDLDDWDEFDSQESATLLLTAGKRYRVDTRLKQADGASHVSVAWQKPGTTQAERGVVPGSQLTPEQ